MGEHRFHKCVKKKSHKTLIEAETECRRLNRIARPKLHRGTYRIYRCPHCGLHHVGKDRALLAMAIRRENVDSNMGNLKEKLTKAEKKTLGYFIAGIVGNARSNNKSRTLNKDQVKCYDCGLPYFDFICDFVIQNELWKIISPTKDEGGVLCPLCMIKRIYSLGFPAVVAKIDTTIIDNT